MTRFWYYCVALSVTLLSGATTLTPQVHAQSTLSPPRQDSSSSTGVSFRNGTFSVTDQDLSVGSGSTGLSLHRVYNSGVVTPYPGPGANWAFDSYGYVKAEALPIQPGNQVQPGSEPYVYNVVFGGKSVGFLGGSVYTGPYGTHTGGPVGTYRPALASGAQLVFNGNSSSGNYIFTDSDGTTVNFSPGPDGRIVSWTMPDGTVLNYTYSGQALKSIISSRGWALLFESGTKVCAVNMARTFVSAFSVCPNDSQTVTYGTTPGSFNTATKLLTSATRGGIITTYQYNNKDHLNCIKDLGQAVCRLYTTYTECANDPFQGGTQYELHLRDYVTSQQDASGKTYTFQYSNLGGGYPVNCPKWEQDPDDDYRVFRTSTSTMTENGTVSTLVTLDPSGTPISIVDPLSRTRTFGVSGVSGPMGSYIMDASIKSLSLPEGNYEEYSFDDRGNMTVQTLHSKPGSGLPDVTVKANFPSTCGNVKTCNKPMSKIDANGNSADYTYDTTHGGVLTETLPAGDNGIRLRKRYSYVSRAAWIKNSGGGYSQAGSGIWLLAEIRMCQKTATVGSACAGGSADEVVTAYDYGPNTGPNNLLLRGVAVTAGGVTRRTCYGYDRDGNKIWETSPRAGLGVCS